MRRALFITVSAAALAFLLSREAAAQSSPGWSFGYTPTAAQWNAAFAAKQDFTGVVPLNITGGTMLGELTTAAPTLNGSGFNLSPGVSPSSPNNGDLWTTSAGIFVQINGSTIQLASGTALGSILGQNNTWTGTNQFNSNQTNFGTGVTLALAQANFTNSMGVANPQIITGVAYYLDNSQVVPLSSGSNVDGLAITWNFSSGPAEVDFWNTFTTATESYEFKQIVAPGSFKNLVNMGLTNGTAASSLVYMEEFGTQSGAISMVTQANAGTYNWLWPTTAGGSGQILTSAGGTGAMTWSNAGAGTVTSAVTSGSAGVTVQGTCTITTTGNCTIGAYLGPPQGRLTLISGAPVMTIQSPNGTAGAQTLYYAPYNGYTAPIWNGSTFVSYQFTTGPTDAVGKSISLAGGTAWAANTLYDVYLALNGTALTLCTGSGWSSLTNRGTAGGNGLNRINGIFTNTGTMTCRSATATTFTVGANQGTYLGTFATDASVAGQITFTTGSGASGGSAAVMNLWNYYNRVVTPALVTDTGTSYTYTSATQRAARGSTSNRIIFVTGAAEDGNGPVVYDAVATTTAVLGAAASIGVSYNGTSFSCVPFTFTAASANAISASMGNSCLLNSTSFGQNFYQAVEQSDGSNANTFDTASDNQFALTFRN